MSIRSELLSLGANQYKDKLANTGMTEVEVPEFDCSFFCPPALTVKERTDVVRLSDAKDPKLGATLVVYCSRTQEGSPIFKLVDVNTIMKDWDPLLVDKLAGKYLDIVSPQEESTVDEVLKNSKATQSSITGSGSQKDSKSK